MKKILFLSLILLMSINASATTFEASGWDDMCSVSKFYTHKSKSNAKSIAKSIILDTRIRDQFDRNAFFENAKKPNELESYFEACIKNAEMPSSEFEINITGDGAPDGKRYANYNFNSNEIEFDVFSEWKTPFGTRIQKNWIERIKRDVALMRDKEFYFPFYIKYDAPSNFFVKEPDLGKAKNIVNILNRKSPGTLKIKMKLTKVTDGVSETLGSGGPFRLIKLTPTSIEVFDQNGASLLNTTSIR